MESPLINLLPLKRLRVFRRAYFLRLATTALILASVAVLIHAILLTPAYVYLKEQIIARQAQLDGLNNTQTPEQQRLTSEVALFEKNASRLTQLDTTISGSDVLRSLLPVDHTGITLSGFTYTPDQKAPTYTLIITGKATTREALRQYDSALSAIPFVSSVDLPIGAYAKEINIPFTLTLVGKKP